VTTIGDALEIVMTRMATDAAMEHSYKELMEDPKVLLYGMALADLPGGGVNAKVLHALCAGILIGIQSERGGI